MNHKIIPGDKRILDPGQFGLLGQTLNVVADNTDGINKNPNTILVQAIKSSEVGATFIQRELNTSRKLNAENQYAPSIITMAIEATVTKLGESANVGQPQDTLLQGILRFGTGMANQGTQSSTRLAFANITLDPRIIFDIAEGTILSFPASYFQIDLLYTSNTTEDTGFATAGDPLGPNYQVVYSLGYEQRASARPVTMTQLAPARDLASGGSSGIFFSRPKFASEVYFFWFNWTTTGPQLLDITFYNAQGNGIWHVQNYTGGLTPPAVIPWPADAIALKVEQSSGAPFAWFKCVSILEF